MQSGSEKRDDHDYKLYHEPQSRKRGGILFCVVRSSRRSAQLFLHFQLEKKGRGRRKRRGGFLGSEDIHLGSLSLSLSSPCLSAICLLLFILKTGVVVVGYPSFFLSLGRFFCFAADQVYIPSFLSLVSLFFSAAGSSSYVPHVRGKRR